MARMGDWWQQIEFEVTTVGQDLITVGSAEARDPVDVKLQNNHATGIVYGHLGRDVGYALPYTSGGTTAIAIGDTITGETGGATARVVAVDLDSGTWAGGDAAGTLYVDTQSGAFQTETIKVGASLNLANITSDTRKTGLITINPGGGTFEMQNLRSNISLMGSVASNFILRLLMKNAGR